MRFIWKCYRINKVQQLSLRCCSHFNRSNDGYWNQEKRRFSKYAAGIGIASWIAYEFYEKKNNTIHLATEDNYGKFREDLPTYSLSEVQKHTNMKTGVWVTYKDGIYNITDFIPQHPGGDQILLGAGSSVEPFWMVYGVHKKKEILELLEKYRIGNLDLKENRDNVSNMSDIYANDPRRHTILVPASEKPFNAEPPPSVLIDSAITPNEFFYVRNHLPVPDIDCKNYELTVEVEGKKKKKVLSLNDLKKLPKHTITASLMCAGNRRSEMTEIQPVKGLSWGPAAIGNATWSGPRLRDVLKLVGIDEKNEVSYNHIQFEGCDMDPTGKPYGASIPIWRALDKRADVILAYEMNGEPLPRDHGYPVRVVVPGVVGARNVKWLDKIVVSTKESDSHWQQNDYKGFSPTVNWDTVDFTKSPAIQELPVTSAICKPIPGSSVKIENNHIVVKGYAWSGNGQKIIRVDVTVDEGKTWTVATFDYQDKSEPPSHWAWTLWTAKIPVSKETKEVEIWSKAVDSSYNVQPESFKNIWNLRGVLGNAYHKVKVNLKQ